MGGHAPGHLRELLIEAIESPADDLEGALFALVGEDTFCNNEPERSPWDANKITDRKRRST